MRLDSLSARRIAKNQIKVQSELVNERITIIESEFRKKSTQSSRFGSVKKWLEQSCYDTYKDALMYMRWNGRMFNAVFFHKLDNPISGIPQLEITLQQYNTRSNNDTFTTLAVVSMHCMERLMERKEDTNLFKIVQEEFCIDFLNIVNDMSVEGRHTVATLNGTAVVVINCDEYPTIVTWY